MAESGAVNGGADDPFELQRFVTAQDGGVYDQALAELRRGRKSGHWIWFVFPQLAGLGLSATSQFYAISGAAEAKSYLDQPVLGPRLIECAETVRETAPGANADSIMGDIDAVKLRSSMTLFAAVAPERPVFTAVLDRFFAGRPDPRTEELLSR